MTKDEALKLAKELDGVIADVEEGMGFDDVCLGTIKYVREALTQPQEKYQYGTPLLDAMTGKTEPPCKTGSQCTRKCPQCEHKEEKPMHPEIRKMWEEYFDKCFATFAATPPPRKQWVGLTYEEWETTFWSSEFSAGAKWAEAKLKEKNT